MDEAAFISLTVDSDFTQKQAVNCLLLKFLLLLHYKTNIVRFHLCFPVTVTMKFPLDFFPPTSTFSYLSQWRCVGAHHLIMCHCVFKGSGLHLHWNDPGRGCLSRDEGHPGPAGEDIPGESLMLQCLSVCNVYVWVCVLLAAIAEIPSSSPHSADCTTTTGSPDHAEYHLKWNSSMAIQVM